MGAVGLVSERLCAGLGRGVAFILAWMLCVPGALALTRIELISDPGDYVGGGQTFSLTLADGTIVASPYSGGIEVRFNGTPPDFSENLLDFLAGAGRRRCVATR